MVIFTGSMVHRRWTAGELCFRGWVFFPGEDDVEASVDQRKVRGWGGGGKGGRAETGSYKGWRLMVQEEKLERGGAKRDGSSLGLGLEHWYLLFLCVPTPKFHLPFSQTIRQNMWCKKPRSLCQSWGEGHSDPRQALNTRRAPQPSCQHPPTQACPHQCHHIDANINADDEAQQQQDGVAQVLAVVGVGAMIRDPPRPWPLSHGHEGPQGHRGP